VFETWSEKMMDMKSWYMSKTVWGGAFAAAAGLAELFGLQIQAGEQIGLAEQIPPLVGSLGGIVAIIGRVFARSRLR